VVSTFFRTFDKVDGTWVPISKWTDYGQARQLAETRVASVEQLIGRISDLFAAARPVRQSSKSRGGGRRRKGAHRECRESFSLEARLPTLKKKRFYGTIVDGRYRACVAVDDDTRRLELPRWVIPGGRYAVRKIVDWEKHRDQIGPTVGAMRSRPDIDLTRLFIEFIAARQNCGYSHRSDSRSASAARRVD
jgi:hypothetical protein